MGVTQAWLAFEALSLFPDIRSIRFTFGQFGHYQDAWARGCESMPPVVLDLGQHAWWKYANPDAVSDALAVLLKSYCWMEPSGKA